MVAPVSDRFHITGSSRPRPSAGRVIYADGAGAVDCRPGIDTELSHWVPNSTDAKYKADSSTEICLRYAADPDRDDADLVVNDHPDVDGILSLYALVETERALEHADTLIAAASMGDFWAWADWPGFALEQELARLLASSDRPADIGDLYEHAFKLVSRILDGDKAPGPEVAAAWRRVDGRTVEAAVVSERLVSVVYPEPTGGELGTMLTVPPLNAIVDHSVWMSPVVRNREHGQRVQLVSIPVDGAWFHDVWAPSYCWAETPDRWLLPGLVTTSDSNRWAIEHEPLRAAIEALEAEDGADGHWMAATELTPWTTMRGRAFPVIASHVDADGHPSPSSLPPATVAAALADLW